MKSKALCRLMFACFAVLLMSAQTPASASVPQQITYQGYLTATDGTPINKAVTLRLSLYDLATGGTLLWTEQQGVTVTSG